MVATQANNVSCSKAGRTITAHSAKESKEVNTKGFFMVTRVYPGTHHLLRLERAGNDMDFQGNVLRFCEISGIEIHRQNLGKLDKSGDALLL